MPAKTLSSHPNAIRAREWRAKNPVATRAAVARYRKKKPKEALARQQRWRDSNKEHVRALRRASKKRCRVKETANQNARRARQKSAVCSCCSREAFNRVYGIAMLVGHEVDHIQPLARGGLHCVKNLQIISREQHKEKTARDRAEIRKHHAAAK
jgi:ferric-dicitrate binding protein FerR (iron transport regulator)